MVVFLYILIMVWNFFVSWSNARYCGMYWSESKAMLDSNCNFNITGKDKSFRVLVVSGYIMAIAGFTMVYASILLLIAPFVLPLFIESIDIPTVTQLAADFIYILLVATIIPSGFIIWFNSVRTAWNNRTFGNIANAVYNTGAQLHNVVNASREVPSAFGRITETLLGSSSDSNNSRSSSSRSKKKSSKNSGEGILVLLAILIVILAICGGYFTASAIMHKADREYDMLNAN